VRMRSSISGSSSFRDVMDIIEREPCTIEQLAARTGMTREAVLGRLEAMVSMGLLETVGGMGGECRRGCHGCRGPCSSRPPTAYCLTDKGRRSLASKS